MRGVDSLSARSPSPSVREQHDPELVKAAQGLEALFINQMLDAMRKTVPENPLSMENQATKIYRSLQDEQISEQAARNDGVGLATQIVDYMESQRYNQPKAQGLAPSEQSGTGGTQ